MHEAVSAGVVIPAVREFERPDPFADGLAAFGMGDYVGAEEPTEPTLAAVSLLRPPPVVPVPGPEPLVLFDDGLEAELRWQERALCAQTDPEAFFPEKGGSTREAKRVCTGCEVRNDCLEYALAHDERFGIWGGLSERERRRLKKRAV